LDKVDSHSAAVTVWVTGRVVDQHGDLLGPDFAGTVAKHKEDRVQNVAFATSIGANYRRHALINRKNEFSSKAFLHNLMIY